MARKNWEQESRGVTVAMFGGKYKNTSKSQVHSFLVWFSCDLKKWHQCKYCEQVKQRFMLFSFCSSTSKKCYQKIWCLEKELQISLLKVSFEKVLHQKSCFSSWVGQTAATAKCFILQKIYLFFFQRMFVCLCWKSYVFWANRVLLCERTDWR